MAFYALSLYQKWPFINLYQLLSKMAFSSIFCFFPKRLYQGFLLYRYIKNGLYKPLSRTAFFALSLYCFIENGLYLPLSKTVFFALLLYRFIKKRPLLAYI